MIATFKIIACLSFSLLLYIYIGYPMILILLRFIFFRREINKRSIRPSVSLIISCYNEENVIDQKLQNSLAIDYPRENLEIIVVSDASSDRTDEVVKNYFRQGVKLIRQEERLGKTAGLNRAVAAATGDIVVFSDANAFYDSDAIIHLVENFADDKVGYVVGAAQYSDSLNSAADRSEKTYWRYEFFLKLLESKIHSVVGGDGAIYAIRRGLYEELLPTDINDFVNPVQIILKGYRGVFEPNATSVEETSGTFRREYERKVRIVNRSFSGLRRLSSAFNPFRTGIFSLKLVSHKLLRWFTPFILLVFMVSSAVLAFYHVTQFQLLNIVIVLFFCCSFIGYFLSESSKQNFAIFYYPYYFVSINLASFVGICRSFSGRIQATWNPTRADEADIKNGINLHSFGIYLLFVFSIWLLLANLGLILNIPLMIDKMLFWLSFGVLLYVFFVYPLLLWFWAALFERSTDIKDITPLVTLMICAYNEEEVIEQKIRNSFQLDYPKDRLKIVVASDGSTDHTNEIIQKYENEQLTLIDYPVRSGKINIINKTVPKLKSEIILFSDANTMCAKDAVKKIVRSFNDPAVGAVSADVILVNEKVKFGKGEDLYYLYERWIQENETKIGSIIGADGGLYAIRRELFSTPSSNIILDDFVISMNVALKGFRLVYDKDVLAHERNLMTSQMEFTRKSRVVAGAVQAIRQSEGVPSLKQIKLLFCYISHKFLRWMTPVCLLLIFWTNLRLALVSGEFVYVATLSLQVLFYFFAFCGIFFRGRINNSLISIPYYFCLTQSASLYGIYKGVFDKQSVMWKTFKRQNQPAESMR